MRINRRAFLGGTVVAFGFLGTGSWGRLASGQAVAAPGVAPAAGAAAPVAAAPVATPVAGASMPTLASLKLPLESVRVVAVHPITAGALPVVLEHHGQRFQVDVLRRAEGGAAGVVETQNFSLFVHNEGNGSIDTGSTHELGARALGLALERDEASTHLTSSLVTFAERMERFPDGMFHIGAPTGVV